MFKKFKKFSINFNFCKIFPYNLSCFQHILIDFSEIFFFKQKTAYELGLGIPAEPLFRSFLNPQCLASISRWITASSSWKRFCLFVCRALSSIMVICMLTAIRLLLTFVMSLYLLLRS